MQKCVFMLGVFMRTTLEIEDELFREMKIQVAKRGGTLKQFVTKAIEKELSRSAAGEDRPRKRIALPL